MSASDKVRVQVDLSSAEATLLELLQKRLSVRSRADLLQQAYGSFMWIINEMLAGNHVVSVTTEEMERLNRFKELSVPAVAPARFNHYRYLISRPESGKEQLYLKGRNMSVGQLIYKIRSNGMTDEEASADMDLPVEQIREAQVYYRVNRDLVEAEAADEKHTLRDAGIDVDD